MALRGYKFFYFDDVVKAGTSKPLFQAMPKIVSLLYHNCQISVHEEWRFFGRRAERVKAQQLGALLFVFVGSEDDRNTGFFLNKGGFFFWGGVGAPGLCSHHAAA